jgi:leader peptidase (prepilin peptidase) / N-methyltransferase
MTIHLALVGGAMVGLATGAVLLPVTRRELAAAMARSDVTVPSPELTVRPWHRVALIAASGLLPAIVLARAGWSVITLPSLLLLLGLVPLAYCDLTRFLLPKTMVHATTAAVAVGVLIAAGMDGLWHRALFAALCGAGLFVLLYVLNLANPAWIGFGDVRLAPAVGLGLAWISPLALLQGFFVANIMAAVVGVILMIVQRAGRKSALPFGLFLTAAAVVIMLAWS